MNCRLWSLASRTFVIAALCACALDLPQASVVGQETDLVNLESASVPRVKSGTAKNVKTLSNQTKSSALQTSSDDLTSDSNEILAAPSPKKSNSTTASTAQKRRSVSKRVRKLNVPATLGATKSTRKSEAELDKILASHTTLAPTLIQYGPSTNATSRTARTAQSAVASNNASQIRETITTSKSLITSAPYVEQQSVIQQTNALSPESVDPNAPERYPLFEEDALTQESAPLDDELGVPALEPALSTLERSEDLQQNLSTKVDAPHYPESVNPETQDATTRNETIMENLPTTMDETPNLPFVSPWTNSSHSSYQSTAPSVLFNNQFARYTGLFADFEWLGWQTDSVKQSYAVFTSEDANAYDELSLTPSGTGYRGRVGLRTVYGWDLTGAYTMFDADKSGNLQSVAGTLYTTSGKSVDEIKADADVELNIYDLEIGRWIDRKSWAFRPFAGVRWTKLNQTQGFNSWNNVAVEAESTEDILFASFDDVETTTTMENLVHKDVESVLTSSKSDMYGLRLGAEGSVALFRNLSAYGKGAATIGFGDVSYQTLSYSAQNGSNVIRRAKKSYATPSIETALGLAWRRGGLEVKGGYELNVWSNASSLNGKSSDFMTRGFFAGVAWNN